MEFLKLRNILIILRLKKDTDYSDCAEGSEGPKVPEVPNDLKVLVVDYSKMQHKIIVVSELLLIFASSNL